MAARYGLSILVVSLWAWPTAQEISAEWIVWNVGQGQWITRVDEDTCRHFDVGGERAPWDKVVRACRARRNLLHISHWDWDHISFTGQLRRALPDVCVADRPSGLSPSPNKQKMFSHLPGCLSESLPHWRPDQAHSSNGFSRVFLVEGVLIPGDSSRSEEKVWVHVLEGIEQTRVLILGHHGSRTATSKLLLQKLSQVQLAIASQREARYGHPHPEVKRQLVRALVPLLRTEDWGHIHWHQDGR